MEERARSAKRRDYGEWERTVEKWIVLPVAEMGRKTGREGDGIAGHRVTAKKSKREDRKMIMVFKYTKKYAREI